jgi:D-galactarolactone isomerase
VPIVVDHMGQVPQPEAIRHPGFALLQELLATGRCWIKLSGAYLHSRSGAPSYADAGVVARALIGLAPERMVWGSDWPHPTKKADEKPDDAQLLDRIAEWAPTEAVWRRILVGNPAALYGY